MKKKIKDLKNMKFLKREVYSTETLQGTLVWRTNYIDDYFEHASGFTVIRRQETTKAPTYDYKPCVRWYCVKNGGESYASLEYWVRYRCQQKGEGINYEKFYGHKLCLV